MPVGSLMSEGSHSLGIHFIPSLVSLPQKSAASLAYSGYRLSPIQLESILVVYSYADGTRILRHPARPAQREFT